MSDVASMLPDHAAAERRRARRSLLSSPLIRRDADPERFHLVLRHAPELAEWFGAQLGWQLRVDRAAGFARLFKLPANADGTHPARPGDGRPAMGRRHYVLLCLTLAALDDVAGQTTLVRLAEALEATSREDARIEAFEPLRASERRAFVDVLRFLTSRGILALRDGDESRYAAAGKGDALYDVNDQLVGQLIAAPVPPAVANDPEAMRREHYAETEEGERLRARQRVVRRLVDEPIVYYEDLEPAERAWLEKSLGFVGRLLEHDLGFVVERRREGIAAVDPDGEVSDRRFPDGGSSARHAALLFAEQLTERARAAPEREVVVPETELLKIAKSLVADYGTRCNWRAEYLDGGAGAARLAEDAMDELAAMNLVRRTGGGVRPLPALARFSPAAPGQSSGTRAAMKRGASQPGGRAVQGDLLAGAEPAGRKRERRRR